METTPEKNSEKNMEEISVAEGSGHPEATDASEKKKFTFTRHELPWIVLGILGVLLILSLILLSVRLYEYTATDEREMKLESNLDERFDLFKAEYQSATGEVTVKGADGAKVIAPGTYVDYSLRFRNTDSTAIDFLLAPDVDFQSKLPLPLRVRLLTSDGKYLLGSASEWATLKELSEFQTKVTLPAGRVTEFVLQWNWPFESGNDAYDTLLGDTALDQTLSLSVSMHVSASANMSAEANGDGYEKTLEPFVYFIIFILLLIAAITVTVLYLTLRKRGGAVAETETEDTVEEVPAPALEIVPTPPAVVRRRSKRAPVGKMAIINLDTVAQLFGEGETVTLERLKEKGLAESDAKQLKILGRETDVLDKVIHVETHRISSSARASILRAGGTVTMIEVEEE